MHCYTVLCSKCKPSFETFLKLIICALMCLDELLLILGPYVSWHFIKDLILV